VVISIEKNFETISLKANNLEEEEARRAIPAFFLSSFYLSSILSAAVVYHLY
jgi:hypothetical protein